MKTLRWGLLSTARINKALFPPLHLSPRNVLSAVASRDLAKAQAYAQEHNIPRAFGSYEAMLADPDVDVIYNPLPNSLHAEWTIKAAQAGKHILCEKPLANTVEEVDAMVNAAQKARMVKKIRDALGGSEAGKTIAVLGLTFKPETDDMRDSPSVSILPPLIEKGAVVRAHDPHGMTEAKHMLPDGVTYCDDIYTTFEQADAVVLMTEWNVYRGLQLDRVKSLMKGRVFCDLRNVYDPGTMRAAGFEYSCVGR